MAQKLTKKQQRIRERVKPNYLYPAAEAIGVLKEFVSEKFMEGIDISVNLGVDPRKSDQVVRASTTLPKGTGKTVRVAVFAQGDNATKAKNAGADLVGFEDLAEQIKAGEMNFDVVIATPDAMRIVGQLGQILGPRGLMPNPKVGTVTTNVEAAVNDAKSGQVRYRTDKNGIIHCTVGKANFAAEDLIENITALIIDLKKAKPATSKGVYIKKITLSSTMGPGLPIDIASIPV
ncbi:50S ribosomal protein L1 [Legionella dresdenensis]|uniref:Large ribosomal subunit protein uL1 n=1 Tax=Legionella dresdenensis TaxID=450200 RepID=A0ABV8CEF2_9GAMM